MLGTWHDRRADHRHHLWFQNLLELHELTSAWILELQIERAPYLLGRGLNSEVAENLWMLGSLANAELESLLDDTDPSDVLGRLEHTVWAAQAYTLMRLIEKTPQPDRSALDSLLEQTSWKMGRKSAESHWKALATDSRQDLRSLLLALSNSPFSGIPQGREMPFLIRRAISTEIQIELRNCPHQSAYQEVHHVADALCRLHTHWIRGYIYALNTRVSVENSIERPRCRQRWSLA